MPALKETAAPEITRVTARQIFDSRGFPTVEVDVYTHLGKFTAGVPSGKSTGIHEAAELRDGDASKYLGKGVSKAVQNVIDVIGPALVGMDPTQQEAIDQRMCELDGTENKSRLGANAIVAVSMAVARAGAAERGVPLYQHIADLAGNKRLLLPVPSLNVINGGVHAGNALAFQEFMILPMGASSFEEAMRMASETYHHLKAIIQAKYGIDAVNVGDEGGFAPTIQSNEEGAQLLTEAIKAAGHEGKVRIVVDAAASEFFDEAKGKYNLLFKAKVDDGSGLKSGAELAAMYRDLCKKYPIEILEDPFHEDDWDTFKALTAENLVPVMGDDILCTNPKRVQRAINEKTCNMLLLKINQIGTLTEAIQAVRMAKQAGWGVMTSHRSGETEDSFIADMTVGLATGLIKTGACCRSERLAKYNQLLRIEQELGEAAEFTGANWRHIGW